MAYMKMKISRGEFAFQVFNYILLSLITLLTLYPLWDVIRISISTPGEAAKIGFYLWPESLSLAGYSHVLANEHIWRGYLNTIIRIALGLSITMPLLITFAYPLSKRSLPWRPVFTFIAVFTMFFRGGIIPEYLNVRNLGLLDSIWALVLPQALNTYWMLILRNFFMTLPDSLEDSAKIDGASLYQIIIKLVLPLSKAILLTLILWSSVWHWNQWFDVIIYIRDGFKFPLQAVLRKIVIDAAPQFEEFSLDTGNTQDTHSVEVVKAATIIVSTLPILAIYPFIQKHFITGITLGAVKG